MKPIEQTELAFESGFMFCFGHVLGDCELQDSFRGFLTLRLVVEVHSLLFLASQTQKEHSMDDLLKFLLFLITVLLEPNFLRQYKTDLGQYPLAPTSTAKSSKDHPIDSIVVFNSKYLLILVLCHDPMFFSQGYVNSMSIITFLKTLEKIVIAGLS